MPLGSKNRKFNMIKISDNHLFVFKSQYFSGPLDLLLQLVRDNKMDLLQINISKITNQYILYLKSISQPDLNRSGDFIRMASWLLYLKSKSLIPEDKAPEDEPDIEEFKKQLSSLLTIYKKFQKIAHFLYSKNVLGRDCWKSGHQLETLKQDKKIKIADEEGLIQLSQAYYRQLSLQKKKKNYIIKKAIPTLMHRLKEAASFFRMGLSLKFSELVKINRSSHSVLLSFLSLLELSKSGFVRLFQERLFSNIDITVKKTMTKEDLRNISQDTSDEEDQLQPSLF